MHSFHRFFLVIVICLLSVCPSQAAEAAKKETASPRFVRVGHYQCVCRQGDFEANLATVQKGLAQAVDAKLDIVSFPECFLTGYYAKGDDARAHAFTVDSLEMKRVLAVTADCDTVLLVGFNELRDDKLYNTVAVIERGKLLGRYSKALPYEGYFEPGREFTVFEKKGLKFGIVICSDGGYIEPTRILSLKGARLIFAPHFNFVSDPLQHNMTVRSDHIARAVENGVYFLRANNVVAGTKLEGLRNEGFGYGDSYLLDPHGQIVAGAGLFHEHLMVYQLDLDQKYRAAWNSRSVKSGSELIEQLREALELHKQPKSR